MKKRIYLLAVFGILLDQITKLFANLYLDDVSIIPNFLNLTYVENKGAAWGILSSNRLILICISVLTLLIISKYLKNETNLNKLSIISYGLLIGGIFGNLFDRLFRGYVIDFLNFNIFGYDFPVFNIADTLIVLGVILMVIEVIGGYYGSNSKKK